MLALGPSLNNTKLRRQCPLVRLRHAWFFVATFLLLFAAPAHADKVIITPESPEGQNIANAANLLERFGAVDVANRVRERLKNGNYSYDTSLGANAETGTGSQYTNIAARNIRFTDLPALRGKPLDPDKNFDTIFDLACTLFHEDVHSGQGYFSSLWGTLPGETTHETDAWSKTIAAQTSWIMNGLATGSIPLPQLQLMAKSLAGYIGSFAENKFYGLDQSQRQGYLNLQAYMQKLSNGLSAALSGGQTASGLGNVPLIQPPQSETGAAAPRLGITCKNSNDDCADLGRIAAQKQIDAVRAKDELSQVPSWLSQADSLDRDAKSYQDQATHSSKLAAGYAELNDTTNEAFYKAQASDYQAKSDTASTQAKALREKANNAKANADALEKAAQDAWNLYYACLRLPPCPKNGTGTGAGGNTVGAGTASGVGATPVSFTDCPEAKSALDSANFWHQQAVKDLELAAQAKLDGNAAQAQGWELQAKLDEGSARMWEREAAYALEKCHQKKTTTAGQPGSNAIGNNPVPGTSGNATPPGGNAAGGAAGVPPVQPGTTTGKSPVTKKTQVPPMFSGGTSTIEPSSTFPGGTKRIDTIPGIQESEVTERNADGSLTIVYRYDPNGKLKYTTDITKSPKFPGGGRYVTKYPDGSYSVTDQAGTVDERTNFDASGKIIQVKKATGEYLSGQPDYTSDERFGPDGKLTRAVYVQELKNADGTTTTITQNVRADGTATVNTVVRSKDGSTISDTTTQTKTPGLDVFGKGLQQAMQEEERKAAEKKNADNGLQFDPHFQPGLPGPDTPGANAPGSGDTIGSFLPPSLRLFDSATGQRANFFATFPFNLPAGTSGAIGNLNGDGKPFVILGAGPGSGPQVRVFDGATGKLVNSFFAYDPTFTGGVFVAAGDVNGDGKAEIITGPGVGGGPQVKVFNGTTGQQLNSFFAYDPGFTGGVHVAVGDVNGDGKAEIITGAGPGGGPQVKVFNGTTVQQLSTFVAADPTFTGGVYVAVGDVNGDGRADIITGAGPGGGPHVKVFDGATGQQLNSFFAYDPSFNGGVHVAVGNLNGNGMTDIITGAGLGGDPHVKVFDGSTGLVLNNYFALPQPFIGNSAPTETAGGGAPQVGEPPTTNYAVGGLERRINNPEGGYSIERLGANGFVQEIWTYDSSGKLLQTESNEDHTDLVRRKTKYFYSSGSFAIVDQDVVGDNVINQISNYYNPFGQEVSGEGFHPGAPGIAVNSPLFGATPGHPAAGAGGNIIGGVAPVPETGVFGGPPAFVPGLFNPYMLKINVIPNDSSAVDPGDQPGFTDPEDWDEANKREVIGSLEPSRGIPPAKRGGDGNRLRLTPGARQNSGERAEGGSFRLAALRISDAPFGGGTLVQQAPAPAQPATPAGSGEVEFAIVSNGKTGADALQFQVFDPSGQVKRIRLPAGVVLEPLKPGKAKPVAERHPGAQALTQQIGMLCLDFAKLPPAAGTLYRIAPQAIQEKFQPLRSILQAGHSLADKGQLHPDSEPKAYATFIRQFALWSKLEKWDVKKFTDVFLQRSRDNAKTMNVKWTKQMEDTLLGAAPGRWRDITAVLTEAESISRTRPAKAAD